MIQKLPPITVALLIISIGAGAYFISYKNAPVYFRIVEEPLEEQTGSLDVSRIEWIQQKDMQKGVHLYSFETGNPYELLFYDNTHHGENLYYTFLLRAKLYHETLRIDIDEHYAVDDGFVNDRILAHFIIKEKPAVIEVYRNNVKELFEIESGNEAISE